MIPSKLLANASRFIGKEIVLEVTLISHNSTYVVQSDSEIDSLDRVLLPHIQVQRALLDEVPCLVGGRALYIDRCSVSGTLVIESGVLVLYPHVIEIRRTGNAMYVLEISRVQ